MEVPQRSELGTYDSVLNIRTALPESGPDMEVPPRQPGSQVGSLTGPLKNIWPSFTLHRRLELGSQVSQFSPGNINCNCGIRTVPSKCPQSIHDMEVPPRFQLALQDSGS